MPLRQGLEEAAPRRVGLAVAVVAAPAAHLEAGERPDVLLDPGRLRRILDQIGDGLLELRARLFGGVGVEDPGLGVDHLAERPVGHSLAVGERTALAPDDEVRILLHGLEELPDEAALADPRDAHERDELDGALGAAAAQGVLQQVDLGPAAHERSRRALDDVDAEAGPRLDRLPRRDGLGLALCEDGVGGPVRDRAIRGAVGRLADQDAVDRRGGLEPGGGVDDVAGGHPLPAAGVGTEDDQRLAGVDAHPDVEVEAGLPLVQPVDRSPDRERRPDRPLGIVLMRHGRSEERHHGVADELLDRPAVVLEVLAQEGVIRRERAPHVLDVHALAAAREAHQVGEEDGDDLALLARGASAIAEPQLPQNRKPSGLS